MVAGHADGAPGNTSATGSRHRHLGIAVGLALTLTCSIARAEELTALIARIKPSVVGVGTTQHTRRPPHDLRGTGFAVGDGRLVLTNAHVVPDDLNEAKFEKLVIFTGTGSKIRIQGAVLLAKDTKHDIALLRYDGPKLPGLKIAGKARVPEGTRIAFTGFPIGAILGLYPVTHTGTISAITPTAIPAPNSSSLTANQIRALRDPYLVYQLDATAYPGNSGSPLLDMSSGMVVGIINKVLVKKTKENLLRDPSNITYAIPASYLLKLIAGAKL
jgi:serine protease Do